MVAYLADSSTEIEIVRTTLRSVLLYTFLPEHVPDKYH